MAKNVEMISHAAVLGYLKFGRNVVPQVFLGKQHADCFHQAANIKARTSSKAADQGFLTSKGKYVDREQAAKIAVKAGQVAQGTKVLCSEDLWSERHGGKFNYDFVRGYIRKSFLNL